MIIMVLMVQVTNYKNYQITKNNNRIFELM